MQLPKKRPTLNGIPHCQHVPLYGETDEESTVAPLDSVQNNHLHLHI